VPSLAQHADPHAECAYLEVKSAEADVAYCLRNAPIVDDATYDVWHVRLDILHREHADLLGPSVRRVGGGLDDAFAPVPHAVPMLPLDNTYGPEDIAARAERLA